MAEEGIRAARRRACRALAARRATTLDARSDALYGAWLCGSVLGSVGMALHHKLCHTLGGSFNLPHAETHTVVLPHAAGLQRAPPRRRRCAASPARSAPPPGPLSRRDRHLRSGAHARRADGAARDRHARERPRPRRRPGGAQASTPTRGRSSAARSASCCSTPATARGRLKRAFTDIRSATHKTTEETRHDTQPQNLRSSRRRTGGARCHAGLRRRHA